MTSAQRSLEAGVRAGTSCNRLGREASERQQLNPGQEAIAVLRLSFWLGLIVGLAELGLMFAQKPLIDAAPGLFRMNRHIFWTIPLVNLAIFGLCGLSAALTIRLAPRLRRRRAVAPIAFLACFTLALACRWLHFLACLAVALLLAMRLTRRIDMSFSSFDRVVRRSMPALGLIVTGLIGCSFCLHWFHDQIAAADSPKSFAAGQASPNVLLVVLDTVRADHLSLYGYHRETSPNLSRLARHGVLFEQARSTAPWTLPSHASMMTGRWPHELSTNINHPLDETYPTLAEFLGEHGYATAGFVGNTTYCGVESGISRGFAHFEDHELSPADVLWTSALGQRIILQTVLRQEERAGGHPLDYHREDAEAIRRSMLAWVERQKDRPFFAFLNLYDAHNPYIQPKDFDRPFSSRRASPADLKNLERWFIQDKSKLTAQEIQFVINAYDDGIAYLDEQLGQLFEDLERTGLLASTLVIITADHGEELGEHGLYGHASSLYDGEIRVPLLVFLPGGRYAGKTISSQVSLHDLAATIVDLTGLGDSAFPGRSLAQYWAEGATPLPEPSLSEVDGPVMCPPNQGRSPVFRGPMKAVASENSLYIKNGDGKEELFDVASDPEQLHDLSQLPGTRPVLDQLRSIFQRLTSNQGPHVRPSRRP